VRAGAFLPYVTGLTLLIVAAPLAWLVDHDAQEATAFLAAALALLLTAALMKRGVFLAALVLAAGLVVILITMFASIGPEARRQDALSIVSTILGMVLLSWFALRAVAASWRLRRVAWRSRNAATILSTVAQLPRDHRLSAALEPLVSALTMYVFGILAALFVAIATGIGLLAGLAFLPFALAGSRLMQRARQTLALRSAEVRDRDPRPPVLFVRSFVDDLLELAPKVEYFQPAVSKATHAGRIPGQSPDDPWACRRNRETGGGTEPAGRRAGVRARAGLAGPRERPFGRLFVGGRDSRRRRGSQMGIRTDPAARSDRTLHLGGAAGDAGGIPRALGHLPAGISPREPSRLDARCRIRRTPLRHVP